MTVAARRSATQCVFWSKQAAPIRPALTIKPVTPSGNVCVRKPPTPQPTRARDPGAQEKPLTKRLFRALHGLFYVVKGVERWICPMLDYASPSGRWQRIWGS